MHIAGRPSETQATAAIHFSLIREDHPNSPLSFHVLKKSGRVAARPPEKGWSNPTGAWLT